MSFLGASTRLYFEIALSKLCRHESGLPAAWGLSAARRGHGEPGLGATPRHSSGRRDLTRPPGSCARRPGVCRCAVILRPLLLSAGTVKELLEAQQTSCVRGGGHRAGDGDQTDAAGPPEDTAGRLASAGVLSAESEPPAPSAAFSYASAVKVFRCAAERNSTPQIKIPGLPPSIPPVLQGATRFGTIPSHWQ